MTRLEQIKEAERHLRQARNLLAEAGAPKTLARVRLALTSIGGAIRHAELEPYRVRRQQEDKVGAA